jgi:hypothetical protein
VSDSVMQVCRRIDGPDEPDEAGRHGGLHAVR